MLFNQEMGMPLPALAALGFKIKGDFTGPQLWEILAHHVRTLPTSRTNGIEAIIAPTASCTFICLFLGEIRAQHIDSYELWKPNAYLRYVSVKRAVTV